MKVVQAQLSQQLQRPVSRETTRRALKHSLFPYRKPRKLLSKANPQAQLEFAHQLDALMQQAVRGKTCLVFIDEAHFQADISPKQAWFRSDQPALMWSSSPAFQERQSVYGAYVYNESRVSLKFVEKSNGLTTIEVLEALREQLGDYKHVTLIWDNAPAHRANVVKEFLAKKPSWHVVALPPYSPELMPVEPLWKWARATRGNQCMQGASEVRQWLNAFEATINQNPYQIADRLVTRSHEYFEQKIRFSA